LLRLSRKGKRRTTEKEESKKKKKAKGDLQRHFVIFRWGGRGGEKSLSHISFLREKKQSPAKKEQRTRTRMFCGGKKGEKEGKKHPPIPSRKGGEVGARGKKEKERE